MRRKVSRVVRAKIGDKIIVRATLPPKGRDGRLYVFSACGDAEFSPHVSLPSDLIGNPTMFKPTSLRVTQEHPTAEIAFTVDEGCRFCVMQEIDGADDVSAKVRLIRHGAFILWLSRLFSRKESGTWLNKLRSQ